MLKKLIVLSFVLIICVSFAKAQDFKKFRVGIGLGYATASGKGAKGGVIVDFEPGYRINDQILMNFRFEGAAIVRGSTKDLSGTDLDVAAIGSYTLNGQYYLSNNKFRPYVGLGFGIFSMAAISIDDAGGSGTTGDIAAASSEFGVYPRIGFDAAHFTFNIDYNILPNTKGEFGNEFKNSYIGFSVGGYFGGGRK
jgi:hypothetical protein